MNQEQPKELKSVARDFGAGAGGTIGNIVATNAAIAAKDGVILSLASNVFNALTPLTSLSTTTTTTLSISSSIPVLTSIILSPATPVIATAIGAGAGGFFFYNVVKKLTD